MVGEGVVWLGGVSNGVVKVAAAVTAMSVKQENGISREFERKECNDVLKSKMN